jgi:hypothetical protein
LFQTIANHNILTGNEVLPDLIFGGIRSSIVGKGIFEAIKELRD